MKSENLYNILDEEQLELLGRATGGKIIEKNILPRIRVNVINMYKDYRDWDARQVYDELDEFYTEDVLRATKKLEDINDVFRYINSLEYDEETRKQKLIEDADKKYRELKRNICRIMEPENETIREIIGNINDIEHCLLTNLGIRFGFTYEEVGEIVKNKLDFYTINMPSQKVTTTNKKRNIDIELLEKLFG